MSLTSPSFTIFTNLTQTVVDVHLMFGEVNVKQLVMSSGHLRDEDIVTVFTLVIEYTFKVESLA
jgi:hypothetical protein